MADSHTEAVVSNDEHHSEESEVKRLQWAIEKLEELKDHLSKDIGTRILVEIFTSIIDSLVRDVCTDVHRDICFDVLPLPNEDSQNMNRIVQAAGYDVHGQIPEKVPKSEFFNCDHCAQKIGAAKYAAHLAKCMGHGGRQRASRSAGAAPTESGSTNTTSPSNLRNLSSPPANVGSSGNVSPVQTASRVTSPPQANSSHSPSGVDSLGKRSRQASGDVE
ncbi:hypothetical protein GUITHDRAFT_137942 [Guillardia theta CCMP2712]|uniref:SAGA-associated factor 11 n=1 Tax=Guillardia theta (strain CCMP2712) TaxID=905079 RepID=L1JFQ7_GUITC|nr:hypothetical protein GUITHDRAFT_137942 [Guillardia theta CCMP2712]EKX46979.1 hypothetical protein GUITHDRAFT_137942 [Guillardia theta CCMP2712]|mmetsp:Transcript_20034/g.66675  ORF Transcript_20034/g.66675 Transcript_20034/m.66675 type:complete len:219 (-) Transcript_20034:2058-2714(-)|eukprot:XP_005833959.1 hypothetical protein GUITHDRAFT_137942 [Guillardia theta CCMP2712]